MSSAKNPGRFAGLLYVLTSMVGFFATMYVRSKLIVHGNATATASNFTANETLFRLGIARELIGQAGFIFRAVALYELLKGVNRRHASWRDLLFLISSFSLLVSLWRIPRLLIKRATSSRSTNPRRV